jgi:hypothetical protein
MKWVSLIIFLTVLPGPVLFASSGGVARAVSDQHLSTLSSSSIFIRYNKGLLDVHITNATLGDVLRELATHTGAKIILSDPATATQRISIALKAMAFEPGIKRILDGFSYIIFPVGGAALPGLIVLSTPLAQQENRWEPIANTGKVGDPAARMVKEEEPCEAGLQCAIETLKSNPNHLQSEALYALVGSHDPGVMETLVEAISGSGPIDLETQVRTVQVLWGYAANQAFEDEVTINALVQLAQRGNEAVSNIAKQALLDMEKFRHGEIRSSESE